jgi:hypothetical protein
MSYCFRYRVKMISPLKVDGTDAITFDLPDLAPVTVIANDAAHPIGNWVIFKAGGFQTEEAARRAGEQFGDILLIAGAVTRLGIDLGFSRSTLQFSNAVHEAVQQESGRELRAETHGLMTYQEDTVAIIGLDARGSALISGNEFQNRIANWQFVAGRLTERQRNCASLLNDSFFVLNTESQFILRISAVEALCERRESVTQSYLFKFQELRMDAEGKAFAALYDKRSKFLHDGFGRGDLLPASNEALQLAIGVLEADLRSSGDFSQS